MYRCLDRLSQPGKLVVSQSGLRPLPFSVALGMYHYPYPLCLPGKQME